MRLIFILLVVVVLGYVIFKNRTFDFFSIAVISSFLYFYPGLYGKVFYYYTSISMDGYDISTMVYLCLSIYLILLIFFMWINDHNYIKFNNKIIAGVYNDEFSRFYERSEDVVVFILEVIGIICSIYTLYRYRGFWNNFDKVALLEGANRITEYFKYISLFTFVYAFVSDGKLKTIIRLISIYLMMVTFLLGHRSFFAIGLITICAYYFSRAGKKRFFEVISDHKKMFIIIVVAALFFLFVKNVFMFIMNGRFDLIKQRLTDIDYYINSLTRTEANIIMYNVQNVIESKLQYSFVDSLKEFAYLIPFLGKNLRENTSLVSFSDVLNMHFNVRFDEGIGLGSTYIGEIYAHGGIVFVLIEICILFFFISVMNRLSKSVKHGLDYTIVGITLTYFTFYIHRNSLINLLTMVRSYLYLWIVLKLLKTFLYRKVENRYLVEYNEKIKLEQN